MIGAVLYTTYIAVLPVFHPPSAYQLHRPFPPPPYSAVFTAGCLAGAAQSIVATPLDSLKVRFEVNDLLEGKHRSLYQFAKTTLKELGIASAYRGFTLTLIRVNNIYIVKGFIFIFSVYLFSYLRVYM